MGVLARVRLGAFVILAGWPAVAQDLAVPAELPPPDFRGQQFVDSRGCLFMRAGPPGQTVWIPRVTRDGIPLCGNAPSGRRVPIAGEAEAEAAASAAPRAAAPAAGAATILLSESYLVAVGSFAADENVGRALARLQALGYPAARGRPGGRDGLVTVFAGPFASAAEAAGAEQELRGAGFPDATVMAP